MHVFVGDKEDLVFHIAMQSTKYIALDACSCWSRSYPNPSKLMIADGDATSATSNDLDFTGTAPRARACYGHPPQFCFFWSTQLSSLFRLVGLRVSLLLLAARSSHGSMAKCQIP
jgi:hypothetical protein